MDAKEKTESKSMLPVYADSEVAEAAGRLPPGARGEELCMCCNMTVETHLTAANGVMFDVEAVSGDVVIVGLEVVVCLSVVSHFLSVCLPAWYVRACVRACVLACVHLFLYHRREAA